MRDIEESAEKVNRGMANPGLWLLLIGGLLLTPFTGGVSLIVTLLAGIAMGGGPRNMAVAATPHAADLAAPQYGCVRIVCALGSIMLIVIGIMLVASLLVFNAGALGGGR